MGFGMIGMTVPRERMGLIFRISRSWTIGWRRGWLWTGAWRGLGWGDFTLDLYEGAEERIDVVSGS